MVWPGAAAGHARMPYRNGEKQPRDGSGSGESRDRVRSALGTCGHPGCCGDRGGHQSGSNEDGYDVTGAFSSA